MVKLRPYLCALGVITSSAALAQNANSPAPIAPPVPAPTTTAGAPVGGPAPIEPPIVSPGTGQVAPPPVDPAAPIPLDSGVSTLAPNATRTIEFQGDDIGLVLRTLARQGKINLNVSPKIQGTVTLRLEDKTPREAIEVIVQANGLVLDELNGVFFVKTSEERAKEPTEPGNYTFAYATAEKAVPLLQSQLQSGVPPQFDQRTNTVFYREAKSNLVKIHEFLVSIDRPTEQVMIEARLVEVTANPQQSYGINWAGVVGGATTPQTFRYAGSSPISTAGGTPGGEFDQTTGRLRGRDFFLNGQTTGGFGDVLAGQFAILSIPQMSATLRLLNEDRDAEFLANPRVVTSNNQKAEIKITRAQPVPQLNFNEQTAQAVFSGFQDKEFGNTLIVTPVINRDGFISMNVKPEISNKVGDAAFTFGGATVTSPIIDKRTLDSNVLIKSGDTLAIGGLLQDESIKGRTKVPVLGDIPIIGYAFQERTNSRTKRNLLVFVTPTVIKQGYGTGLEESGEWTAPQREEYADPNGWRNNARGAARIVPTSNRQIPADYPKPGIAPAPKRSPPRTRVTTEK